MSKRVRTDEDPRARKRTEIEKPPELPKLPPDLESRVFTHQTALEGANAHKTELCYDRLEFLGDAYLELFASQLLFPRYPEMMAGRLSQQRELLVRNDTLARFARAYGFETRIRCSDVIRETRRTNVKLWTKILGDVMEAYVAAVVVADESHGFSTAKAWLVALWEPILESQKPVETETVDITAKSSLARQIAAKSTKLEYREIAPPTLQAKQGKVWHSIGAFFTGWHFVDLRLGTGKGLSKQEAGQKAAAEGLRHPALLELAALKVKAETEAAE